MSWHAYNPFSKKESHSSGAITAYKVFNTLTWILSVVVSVYYSVHAPHDGFTIRKRIWDQNYLYPSGFTQNSIITTIFWIILFILQGGYIAHLFSSSTEVVHAAASVSSHWILNNLFHFGFVMLFVRSHFHWAELLLVLNLFNLISLYFRHNTYPRFIHAPVVSAPLAWTFVAIYWNGALMVPHQNSLVARIFANIFIFSFLAWSAFFLVIYKDYTMGFSISVLTASIGVAQFLNQVVEVQWILAFINMALIFLLSLSVAGSTASGRSLAWKRPGSDSERAPLLNDA